MSAAQDAESVAICIPLDVVQAMVGLLENDHVAWPIAGAQVLRTLKAELRHSDGGGADG